MPLHQHFPVNLRHLATRVAERDEVLDARRDVTDFVVKDSLQDARAVRIAEREQAITRCRGDVQTACLEHHRHHREPRGDIVPRTMRRFPQAVVRGERATVFQIACYAVLTVAISALPVVLRGANGQAAVGGFYLAAAALLNAVLLLRSFQLYRRPDRPEARSLFKYSMVYLALLFLAMAVDRGPWI